MKKIVWIISLIPLIITLLVLQSLPSSVPMHFDMNGKVDRYGSKYEMLIFPAFILGMAIFYTLFIWYFENKKKNAAGEKESAAAASNVKVFCITATVTQLMFTVIQAYLLYSAYNSAKTGADVESIMLDRITCIGMGVLFVVFGNYMPKTKTNSAVGLRCSWSMYNDVTWRKSNFFGGVALMIVGVATVITGLLIKKSMVSTFLMMGYLTVALVVILVYTYKIYKVEKKKE